MANHARQQIREAVATVLTGLATTGSRVYQSRVYPLAAADLPALRIGTYDEANDIITLMGVSARPLQRSLSLSIEAVAKATSNVDDTLDTICKEVEIALMADPVLGGKVREMWLENTSIEFDGDTDQPVGLARMAWRIHYTTAANAPDVPL